MPLVLSRLAGNDRFQPELHWFCRDHELLLRYPTAQFAAGPIMPRTPIHPGEHLAEELRESGITAAELSRQIDVPVNRITGIIHGQRGITADTALRLGHWFGTTPQFWMNLQQLYELRLAETEIGAKIAALPRRRASPSISRKMGKTG